MADAWKTHGPDFNEWNDDFDKFAELLHSVKDQPWWIKDWDLKYLNVRIDTRDNGFLLLSDEKDGKRERISPDRVVAAIERYLTDFPSRRPAPPQPNLRVADFANRLFDLHGFMLLHSAGGDGKPTITISFPDLKEAQQFHNTLVELSQHRATTEVSDNG